MAKTVDSGHVGKASLLDMPPEVLFGVLVHLDPVDVASMSVTCKDLNSYAAKDNLILWKALFLNLFDAPDQDLPAVIGDYCTCVKDRCKARGILRSPHRQKQIKQRSFVLQTLHNIVTTTPRSLPFQTSKNAHFLESLLSSRSVIKDWLTVNPPWKPTPEDQDADDQEKERHQLEEISSQIHLSGLSMRELAWLNYKTGQAFREEIYRGSNFDETNMYGPYEKNRSDGKLVVDWRLLNGISVVMALNVHGAWDQWGGQTESEILPYGFHRAVFWKVPETNKDWACVTGRWNYIYAFIDYNDYFAYNFAPAGQHGADNDLEGVSEAVGGLNSLELALLPDEEQDWDKYPDEKYPPLKFQGQSSGPTGSTFRGQVKMLADGYRHWEFTIRYSGSDRWVTSGVEVGGRGVYGIWSDVLHEDLSPCGPVWYFRS
ncbi:hypothetical protein P389DRAFT_166730 [Cystobasidium minutum MCA 4210]|uniref:uncharacterized protein n=1 Tax=Cystobasidium minutum MCA 4210 TaxID=1397322 RepID=UPI0034CE5407|eukprot:jgi/Rhomi1/166730/fgenesh1_kg.2_\